MAERYFYTVETPHKWSSGPRLVTYDLDRGEYIVSLERAKELAIQNRKGKWGQEDFVDTSYGVMYSVR